MEPIAVGEKILVRIDKAAQKQKTTLKSGLIIHPDYEYMQYNLQYGRIYSVGADVADPDIRVGRLAIIHHVVESGGPKNLIKVYDNGDELRVVRTTSTTFSYQLYGVFDEEGEIIPVGDFIFCLPEVPVNSQREVFMNPVTRELMDVTVSKRSSGIFTAELPKEEDDVYQVVCEIVAVPKKEKWFKKGEFLLCDASAKYPLDVLDRQYWIFLKEFIHCKVNQLI